MPNIWVQIGILIGVLTLFVTAFGVFNQYYYNYKYDKRQRPALSKKYDESITCTENRGYIYIQDYSDKQNLDIKKILLKNKFLFFYSPFWNKIHHIIVSLENKNPHIVQFITKKNTNIFKLKIKTNYGNLIVPGKAIGFKDTKLFKNFTKAKLEQEKYLENKNEKPSK